MAVTLNYEDKKNNNLKLVLRSGTSESDFIHNDPSYSVGHAAFSLTGDTLIFVSDLENKEGWTDLFFCVKQDSSWSVPIKLGQNINTFGNEMFPHLVGKELFFSSNGHTGEGQLDIYKVNWLVENAEPMLLPYPINSNEDDFGIVFETETSKGYFSSNRKGTDDIYYFDQTAITFDCISACKNDPCVQLEIEDFTAFDDSRFAFVWDFGDGERGEGAFITHCYKDTGQYFVQLSYKDKLTGNFLDAVMTDTILVKTKIKNLPSFTLIDSLAVNASYKIKDSSIHNSGSVVVSAWDIDGELSVVDFPEISFDVPGYKKITRNVKIGDSSCCFQRFYDYVYVYSASNLDTLQKDSLAQNIKEDALAIENKSEKYPIRIVVQDHKNEILENFQLLLKDKKGNICFNGEVKDTLTVNVDLSKEYTVSAQTSIGQLPTTELSLANRTERDFLFTYQIEPKGLYTIKTIDGKGSLLPNVKLIAGSDTIGQTNRNGYLALDLLPSLQTTFSKYLYFKEERNISKMKIGDTLIVTLVKMEVDAIFRLEDIYFDLSKWNIRTDAAKELDKLVVIMKEYPTLEIELCAHTDSRGTRAFNEELSDKRAKSAAAYIVSKGIDSKRLQGKGYGETVLLNNCKDGVKCSSEQHQWNRRVECKIIKI